MRDERLYRQSCDGCHRWHGLLISTQLKMFYSLTYPPVTHQKSGGDILTTYLPSGSMAMQESLELFLHSYDHQRCPRSALPSWKPLLYWKITCYTRLYYMLHTVILHATHGYTTCYTRLCYMLHTDLYTKPTDTHQYLSPNIAVIPDTTPPQSHTVRASDSRESVQEKWTL